MPDFTDEQKRAIHTRGVNLLVSAAAGSGKTAVLVERIVDIITNPEKPVDIDRLLVVTFTEKAAYEMRQRILNRLNDLLVESPGSQNLRRQLALLSKSYIMTIHAFCMTVVRNHFYMAELDPNFKIAEQAELSVLKQELLEELLEEEYEKPLNGDFLELVEVYGGKYGDGNLRDLIIDIHTFIMACPWPEKKLDEYVGLFDVKDKGLDDTVWAPILKDAAITEIKGLIYDLKYASGLCRKAGGPLKYIDNLTDDINILTLLTRASGLEEMYNLFDKAEFSRLYTYRKTEEVVEELKEAVKEIRNKAKDAVKAIKKKYFLKPPHMMMEDIRAVYPCIRALALLVKQFNERFADAKKDRGILDFNDLEQYSLRILLEDTKDGPRPTQAAREMSRRFEEILIDEYQDSNQIQELILQSIAAPEDNNRFMVGDVKQSIYRFRQARPEIFIGKYNNNDSSLTIDLTKNFRSRAPVLDAVNQIFYRLMTREAGEIEYTEKAALNGGAAYPEPDMPIDDTVELSILDFDDAEDSGAIEAAEAEAAIIAGRIDALINGPERHHVYDSLLCAYRPARYGDIVILAASVRRIGETFVKQFKKYDIPLNVVTSGSFFKTLEVNTILSFLQIIDNPKQDIPLLTVLHSPVYSLTADDLVRIKRSGKGYFYDLLLTHVNEPGHAFAPYMDTLRRFLIDLDRWRKLAAVTPISELLWTLYYDTHYYDYVGVMKGGAARRQNLQTLIDRACLYEQTSYRGLFHFIRYVEKLAKSRTDIDAAAGLKDADAVRMMTIHGSKGLEFPIVIVCRLGGRFNFEDQKQGMALNMDYGFGPFYLDLNYRVKSDTVARMALNRRAALEQISEEMRVLYVAMTRAREKLILTGHTASFAESSAKWGRYKEHLPAHYVVKARSFLDWIAPVVLNAPDGGTFKLAVYPADGISLAPQSLEGKAEEPGERLNRLTAARGADMREQSSPVISKLEWQYAYPRETQMPQKISISEIKRLYYLERTKGSAREALGESARELASFPATAQELVSPAFLTGKTRTSAADMGIAIHTVMERLDLSSHVAPEDIRAMVDELTSRGVILPELAAAIPVDKIYNFTVSTLAERVRKSRRVIREAPFVLPLSPSEVYFDESLAGSGERILLHGIIDLYFYEEDGLVLVDYKSDRVKPGGVGRLKEKYAFQLGMYKKALETATGEKVKEVALYLFAIDGYVNI